MRSTTSGVSARRRSMRKGDDWDEDERAGGGGSASRIPLQPPRRPDLYETEEEWRRLHEAEKTDTLHHLPLILVALPPLGAIVHGRAENWSDGLILILVCFYLYQLVKVPWDIYYASHGRVVLSSTEPKAGEPGFDPILAAQRNESVRALKRVEMGSLLMTFVVPFVGSYALHWVRHLLSDPDRYINSFVISVFAIATSIKPFLHFSSLVKKHALYHQERVWYPNADVHLMKGRVETLEKELKQLKHAFATKDDMRDLDASLKQPLGELHRAVNLAGKNEHNLRRSVDFKLVDLDQRLQQAQHDMEATAEQLRQIRFEQEQARSSTLSQLFRVFQFVLSHTRSGPFFWLLLPVTAPLSAVEFVARKTIDVDGGSGSGSSSSERSGGSWEATEGYSRGKDSGRRLRE